jgi:hypothetical protein
MLYYWTTIDPVLVPCLDQSMHAALDDTQCSFKWEEGGKSCVNV